LLKKSKESSKKLFKITQKVVDKMKWAWYNS